MAASMALLGATLSQATTFPSGPIKLVVPFSASGGTDTVARAVAQKLGQRLGQPVVVDNRPGAGGAIGAVLVARSKADGLTLLFGSNGPMAVTPSLDPTVPFNTTRDFRAVAGVATIPYLMVANEKLPVKSVADLVSYAKAHPGQINFASPGNGTTNHLVGELLKAMTGIDIVHVPYKGAAPAMNDVVSGQVQFMSGDLNTLLPMVESGKLKALAVTSRKRTPLLPQVPTVAESGVPGFDASGWFGIFAPRATPDEIVKKLANEMQAVLKDPDVVKRIEALGGAPLTIGDRELDTLVKDEQKKWKSVVTKNRITREP